MRLVYAVALMPFAALANPLETDFDQIFADNAAAVEEKNGGGSVELDNKVLLSRNAEGKYLALDGSPHEAVGCVLQITLQSYAVGGVCPESLTADETATLEQNLQSFAEFYAANNVPMHPVEDVKHALDQAVEALAARFENLKCTQPEVEKFKEFIGLLTSDESQQKLIASLGTPRLPVTQPCL